MSKQTHESGSDRIAEAVADLDVDIIVNVERFAKLYAGGKFRINQWGRVKIKYALKQKQVSDYSIKKGLKEISESDYKKTLQKLADQKLKTLKNESNVFSKKKKLLDYLLGKGFEGELVRKVCR